MHCWVWDLTRIYFGIEMRKSDYVPTFFLIKVPGIEPEVSAHDTTKFDILMPAMPADVA